MFSRAWASPTLRKPGNSEEFALRAFSECFRIPLTRQKSKDPSRRARIYLSAKPLKSLEKGNAQKRTRKTAKREKKVRTFFRNKELRGVFPDLFQNLLRKNARNRARGTSKISGTSNQCVEKAGPSAHLPGKSLEVFIH